ncbi:MAG: DctP family TRAP transporter solute-binding subunit, partial [Alphaproteobacteria bacterium]
KKAAQTAGPSGYRLRFGHNLPEGTALHMAALRYAEEIRRRSGGKLDITVHPNQHLGSDDQMMEMARRGELDIILTPSAKMGVAVPAVQVLDLPFFFPSREALYAALDGDVGSALFAKLHSIGLIGATVWENGFKHFTANRPLRTLGDFSGLRMRAMKSRLIADQFETLRATPIAIDFHTTRQALADSVVDGQENPLVAIVSMKFHEVQKHLTLSGHAYLGYILSISAKTHAGLPSDMASLLIDVAREVTAWEREETQRREEGFLAQIKAANVVIHELTVDEKAAFRRALAPLARRFEPEIGADIISMCQEIIETRFRTRPVGSVAYLGVDASLSQRDKLAGLAIKRGVELALDKINAGGGVLGRELVLLARDNQGIPVRGRDNIRFFTENGDLVAVVGDKLSTVGLSEIEQMQAARRPFLIPWAGASAIVENGFSPNYVFRASLGDGVTAPLLIEAALRKSSRLALIIENSEWGRGHHQLMLERMRTLGVEAVETIWLNPGSDESASVVQHLKESGPGAIVFVANSNEAIDLFGIMARKEMRTPIVAHMGLLGAGIQSVIVSAFDTLDVSFPQTVFLDTPITEKERRVVSAYRQAFGLGGDDRIISAFGFANAYDLTHMLARAIRAAGTFDGPAVRDALEQLSAYDGLVKTYAPPFTPERHDALDGSDFHMARFNRAGAIVPAESGP